MMGPLRWIVSVALGLAVVGIGLLPAPAHAQVFTDVLNAAINNNCRALGVPFGVSAATVAAAGFGPNLSTLCASGTAAARTSGPQLAAGALPDQARFGLIDELRRRRAKDDAEGSASADAGGPIRLSIFASGDYEYFDKDVTRFEQGYRSDTYGGTIGADYTFTRSVIAGLAFNYARTDGDFFQDGGSFDTDAYSVLLYVSLHPTANTFVDFVGGYTRKESDIDRRINFSIARPADGISLIRQGSAIGTPTTDEWRLGASGGYDFDVAGTTVGPRLGLHYRHTTIDDFRERSRNAIGCIANFGGGTTCTPLTGTGLELAFDSQKEDSLRAAAGVFLARAVSLGFGIVVPQATVEYVHEFLRDQRQIRFRFVEDNASRTKFRFENDPPDRDYINASAGLVFVLPRGISPYVNYTGLFGYSDQHRHAVTAGVRVEF